MGSLNLLRDLCVLLPDSKLVVDYRCYDHFGTVFPFLVDSVCRRYTVGAGKDAFRKTVLRNQQSADSDQA